MTKIDEHNIIIPSNDIFITSVRLTIMLVLFTHKKVLLNDLKTLLHLSSGNLDHHIRKLVKSNYITAKKVFFSTRLLTVVEITPTGVNNFKKYLQEVKDVLNQISLD